MILLDNNSRIFIKDMYSTNRFHCHKMKMKLDTKVSLFVVLLAIAMFSSTTAADGENKSADAAPKTSNTPPAPVAPTPAAAEKISSADAAPKTSNTPPAQLTPSATAPEGSENAPNGGTEQSARQAEIDASFNAALEKRLKEDVQNKINAKVIEHKQRLQVAFEAAQIADKAEISRLVEEGVQAHFEAERKKKEEEALKQQPPAPDVKDKAPPVENGTPPVQNGTPPVENGTPLVENANNQEDVLAVQRGAPTWWDKLWTGAAPSTPDQTTAHPPPSLDNKSPPVANGHESKKKSQPPISTEVPVNYSALFEEFVMSGVHEFPTLFGNFFQDVSNAGEKVYKTLEATTEAIQKPDTDQRYVALQHICFYFGILMTVKWVSKADHTHIKVAKKGKKGNVALTGGKTLFPSTSEQMRVLTVVDSTAYELLYSMGHGFLLYWHPFAAFPILYLYMSVLQPNYATKSWFQVIKDFVNTDHIFQCLSYLLKTMLTLCVSQLVTACLMTALYGVPALFLATEGLAAKHVLIKETDMLGLLTVLKRASKDVGDVFYQFETDRPVIKLFLMNLLVDGFMLIDIQHWHQRPAIPIATGVLLKMKTAFMMLTLSSKVEMGMLLRMTPAAVVLHSMSVMLNISWHSLVNPILEFICDVVQAMSPFEWTKYFNISTIFAQPECINHVFNAFVGMPPVDAVRSAAEKQTFFVAVVILVLFWGLIFSALHIKYSHLKRGLKANLQATVFYSHRPHLMALMMLCACLKGFIVLGRPLQQISVQFVPDVIKQWPQVVITMLCIDTALNCVWVAQFALGTLMPMVNSMSRFAYYNTISGHGSGEDPNKIEYYVVESISIGFMLSSWKSFWHDLDKSVSLYHFAKKYEAEDLLLHHVMLDTFDAATSCMGVLSYKKDSTPEIFTHLPAEEWEKQKNLLHKQQNRAASQQLREIYTRNMASAVTAVPMPSTTPTASHSVSTVVSTVAPDKFSGSASGTVYPKSNTASVKAPSYASSFAGMLAVLAVPIYGGAGIHVKSASGRKTAQLCNDEDGPLHIRYHTQEQLDIMAESDRQKELVRAEEKKKRLVEKMVCFKDFVCSGACLFVLMAMAFALMVPRSRLAGVL